MTHSWNAADATVPSYASAHRRRGEAALGVLLAAVLAICAAAPTAASASTVYKWTDEKGVVNYTTTPPDKRKAVVIEAAPAVEGKPYAGGYSEAGYWRERSQREALRDLREERLRGETEALRQSRLRQEAAVIEAQAKQKSVAQLMQEQCRSERRIDCDSAPYGATPYGYPAFAPSVIGRGTGLTTVPGTVFSVTPNFTPGFSKPLVYTNPR